MQKALMQAKVALRNEEVPVGAVVVDRQGKIVSRACNRMEASGCQTGHAEVRAIEAAARKLKNWRLEGCTIYVTLEPCLMCFGLISLSRMSHLIYGATSPLFGCGLDNKESFPLYSRGLKITGGILNNESSAMLREFFKTARHKKKRKL